MNKVIILIGFLGLSISCATSSHGKLDFLTGTWKVNGKAQYEVWEKQGKQELSGYAYRLQEQEKKISERLSVRLVNDQWVYEATVPDQNEGATIRFTLNQEIDSIFSFENLQHDFPKKIQYKRLSKDEVEVRVMGTAGKGFSYIQLRQ